MYIYIYIYKHNTLSCHVIYYMLSCMYVYIYIHMIIHSYNKMISHFSKSHPWKKSSHPSGRRTLYPFVAVQGHATGTTGDDHL